MLVSPPLIDESVEAIKKVFLGAEEKSKKIGALYKKLAKKHGGHLDPKAHKMIADVFAKVIIKNNPGLIFPKGHVEIGISIFQGKRYLVDHENFVRLALIIQN